MTDRSAPPVVVNVADIQPIVRHPEGGGQDWPLLQAHSAGTEHLLFGYCVYGPGRGSQWHSHEEEDCFFIVSGAGAMHYEKDGEEQVIALKAGDAIFSGYLRNFVTNTGEQDLVIVYAISPKDRYEQ